MADKYQVHIVAGPTASGKTKYALELARKVNGELINADSRQIYQYLDIGTNKGKTKEVGQIEILSENYPVFELEDSGISIHLLSFLKPDQQFSAYQYQQLVFALIPKLVEQGKTPILVGGTGLYLDFILHPEKYRAEGSTDLELREALSELSVSELQARLSEAAPEVFAQLNESDRQNPRRLIRRLEAIAAIPAPKDLLPVAIASLPLAPQVHYITLPREELYARINKRVEEMFAQGLVAEVKNVLALGFRQDSIALQGIGYREVLRHVNGETTLVECIEQVKAAHRQYAKRQETWFRKYL